ncbi:MAG: hypothetical protein A2887_06550 [Alphaproteobacteria bacterium RIFCSPLOWO2_01_FULL_40_26]|nr:MAG: hypothetical protein A3D15_01055 [Alphaproteobacteria bacterium RIFCSPHIGHO2_02_FULL_40_34]OFW86837.1 MAG: hypothetical protein A2794_02525 [Alphaproteobacteria bacterium RIFCSPHIGHO2_01_FULL_40_8]OFW94079.1 MAG: hypothetical protein A2887_06550 [Alphaproteobacteria bacterium RIFCSPLOWO2_01_FULL_40_26]OFX09589.1 MAG: hypothetical protein A3H30_00040 [Alphaproteobacteria bacterium RIFCSPLOWO2_02_FULL_40_19]OFX11250.1 MAG: hypothetical protein A3G22_00625 [Alphaproteobacteria bacterium RI
MKKIIAANWKMNHDFDETDIWLDSFFQNYTANYDKLQNVEMVLCPPSILLDYIDSELMEDGMGFFEELIKKEGRKAEDFSAEEITEIVVGSRPIKLGAQDCHFEESGSFTGDISAKMLSKVGCQYVISGHFERRTNHFESNEMVAKKALSAVNAKLIPIICVGESKEIRDANKHLEFVYKQVMQSVPKEAKFEKMVIAYEPIWSIGTGITPTSAQIAEIANLMKKIFAEKFSSRADEYFMLYGGSVAAKNSKEILAIAGIGGLLIGKASLDASEFINICLSL